MTAKVTPSEYLVISRGAAASAAVEAKSVGVPRRLRLRSNVAKPAIHHLLWGEPK